MKITVDVGDVNYSKLSRQLTFTVACNMDAILATEDSLYRQDPISMEEIANEMGKKLAKVILMDYNRGGMRIRYD
tara:strand:+ start:576 stop:800 length:225 start_codon:yes stop_codon:yes gene_type:complete